MLRKLSALSFLVVLVVASFFAGAWAQNTKHVVWKWSKDMDAPIAAPKNHKVLFQDDHVSLLEVTIQPGEEEKMHGHQYPSVFAYDAEQPKLKDHELEGNSYRDVPRGQTDHDWYEPACRTMGPQAPHQVTITDTFPQHFYRLQFKRMDGKNIEQMTQYPPKK